MARLLMQNEIKANLQDLSEWNLIDKSIQRKYTFANFIAAVDFVNKLVEPAETAGHHPDLFISYNKVVVTLTTHDAGGLTEKDFTLARTIDQLG